MTKGHIMDIVLRTIAQKKKIVKGIYITIRKTRIRPLSAIMTIVLTSVAYVNGLRVQRKEFNLYKNVLPFFKTKAKSA